MNISGTCRCGAPMHAYDLRALVVCDACDRGNRATVLRIAAGVRVVDELLADVLVRIAGFGHEFIRKGLRA